jgi:hypothetical protein
LGQRIELPTDEALPPGALRRLITELHQLYRSAGRPGLRTLSAQIRADDTLPATVSHEAIRQLLRGTGGVPRWSTVKSLVTVLTRHTRRDLVAELERFLHLWEAIGDAAPVPQVVSVAPKQHLAYKPDAVHERLMSIVADALDGIPATDIPNSVRGYARYARDKQGTLSTAIFLAWMRDHPDFRTAVVNWCRTSQPDALDVSGSDPAATAAAALLLDEEAAAYYLAVTSSHQLPVPAGNGIAERVDLGALLMPAAPPMIVDGDEVACLSQPDGSVTEQSDWLVERLAVLSERTNSEITVIFRRRQSPVVAVPRKILVIQPKADVEISEMIKQSARRYQSNHTLLVVSSASATRMPPHVVFVNPAELRDLLLRQGVADLQHWDL